MQRRRECGRIFCGGVDVGVLGGDGADAVGLDVRGVRGRAAGVWVRMIGWFGVWSRV